MLDSFVVAKSALDACYRHTSNNKSEVENSSICHCCHCQGSFAPSMVREWRIQKKHSTLNGYVGLTGGIASGKSTVGKILKEMGIGVVDADDLARQVVAPGTPGLKQVVSLFGDDILLDDGSLDRKKLGSIVFSDARKLKALEGILHPQIWAQARLQLDTILSAGAPHQAVYDAALMVEKKLYKDMDHLVVVACDPDQQLARVMARDNLSKSEAQARIDSQLPLEQKLKVAHAVLWNNGSEASLKEQVHRLFREGLAVQEINAICPHCGIDAVIGDASGYEMTPSLLRAMHDFCFERKILPADFSFKWFSSV